MITIRDPSQGNRDITHEIMFGGKAQFTWTPSPYEDVLYRTSGPQSLPTVRCVGIISDASQVDNQGREPRRQKEAEEKKQNELLTAETQSNMSPSSKNTQGVRVFVKNLDNTVDDQLLRKEFRQFGAVLSAEVVKTKGRFRGFGIVSFCTPEEATEAIRRMKDMMLGSKHLHVALEQSGEEHKAKFTHKSEHMMDRASEPWPNPQQAEGSVQQQDIKNTVPPFNNPATVERVGTLTSKRNQDTRVGDVQKNTTTVTDTATQSGPTVVKQAAKLSYAAVVAAPAPVRKEQHQQRRVTPNKPKPQRAQVVSVFVRNLDYRIDVQLLHEEFLSFGTIVSAKVAMENGRSRGFGFVTYSSPEEAAEAIKEMNGVMWGRKCLHVMLAQGREQRKAYLSRQHEGKQTAY